MIALSCVLAITTLDVHLDVERRQIRGSVVTSATNPTSGPLDRAYVWLYPNRFSQRPDVLDDISFHWIYPHEFSPGEMRVLRIRAGGHELSWSPSAQVPNGDKTLLEVSLREPVPAGGSLSLVIEYAALLPERYGSFGCTSDGCTLLGGFYPMVAALDDTGWQLGEPPMASRFAGTMTLAAPASVVVAGRERGGRVVSLEAEPAPYLALIVAPRLYRSRRWESGVVLSYLSPRPPPPVDDAAQQILPYSEEDYAGMGLKIAAEAVDLLSAIGAPLPSGTELVIVEAPLRTELAVAHPGMVVASDRLFRLFPARRFRKFHARQLVRALYVDVLGRRLRSLPAAEVAAEYLLDLFTVREYRRQELARDVLMPVSFVPAVDQLIYAPQVAFVDAYFGAIADSDRFRDDVRRFANERPQGAVYYHKLQDLLEPAKFGEAMRRIVLGQAGLKEAAEIVYGQSLDWFFTQWDGRYPKVNYRVGARTRQRLASGKWRHEVTVHKEAWAGEGPVEPVELRIVDSGGGRHDLRWDGRGAEGKLAFESDSSRITVVAIDPRHRLVESAAPGSSDDPRFDNRAPPRVKFLYNSLGALLNVSDQSLALAADFSFRRVHDNKHQLRMAVFRSEAVDVGGSVSLSRYFGSKVTANRTASAASAGLTASRLSFLGDPGTRLSLGMGVGSDDRLTVFEPLAASGWSLGARWSVTRFDASQDRDTDLLSTVSVAGDVTRIASPRDGHTLVANVEAAAVAGDIVARSQLLGGGGPGGLRGYLPTELFGRARLLVHGEWRGLVSHDLDWNFGHWLWLRAAGLAAFVDAGWLSGCDSYADLFARESFYASAGFGFRFFYDDFGVAQGMTAIDFAVPLVSRPRGCLDSPAETSSRPPLMVYLTFLPPF